MNKCMNNTAIRSRELCASGINLASRHSLVFKLPAIGIALLLWCGGVQAATLVSDRSALGGNDLLDWSSVAAPFAPLASTFSATSAGGLGVSVSIPFPTPPISQPFIFQNGPSISTNFGDGDFILFSGLNFATQAGNPGPITLTFAVPVFAAGAQLLPDAAGDFTGFIDVFDVNNILIGSFSALGTASTTRDNSAPFFGVQSSTANIARLVFSTNAANVGIGINQLSILAAPVPEPPMAPGLLGLCGIALGGLTMRRKRQPE